MPAADRLIEAADWVVWQLTGVETRNSCTAGYKAMWSKREGFPADDVFCRARPAPGARDRREDVARRSSPIGERAGELTPQAAKWTGLKPGTAVAIANVDAHVSVPAATVTEPGRMVMIMGTSTCHMVLGKEEHLVPGMCGYVEDGIIPGSVRLRGRAIVRGRSLCLVRGELRAAANITRAPRQRKHRSCTSCSKRKRPSSSRARAGLLALDWWNGNRSVLVDVDLTGLLLGATLATKRRRSTAR